MFLRVEFDPLVNITETQNKHSLFKRFPTLMRPGSSRRTEAVWGGLLNKAKDLTE